jgi:RNA polymerase sigma-70 factor (ECF subfamily)
MNFDDYTDMGGVRDEFLTTHWSVIENVGLSGDEKNRALIGLLIEIYWKPVYCYLRRRGYGNEQAKDLTQGFFHEVVLGRKLIEKAEQTKGRFRSFLLVALNRYVIDVQDEKAAQKRIPKNKLVSLDRIGSLELPEPIAKLEPEDTFNYAWISMLLEHILEEVRGKCFEEGKTAHWNVFNDRVLQPMIENIAAPTMKEICDKYGIEDGIKASNMIITVKRKFQTVLKQQLCKSVISDLQVDDELDEIVRFLSAKRVG